MVTHAPSMGVVYARSAIGTKGVKAIWTITPCIRQCARIGATVNHHEWWISRCSVRRCAVYVEGVSTVDDMVVIRPGNYRRTSRDGMPYNIDTLLSDQQFDMMHDAIMKHGLTSSDVWMVMLRYDAPPIIVTRERVD